MDFHVVVPLQFGDIAGISFTMAPVPFETVVLHGMKCADVKGEHVFPKEVSASARNATDKVSG